MFHGLRTAIYYVPDIDEAKAWYTAILGAPPYFDELIIESPHFKLKAE